MRKGGQIDIPACLAAGAFDLKPSVAAVDRLIDARRWVDGLTVRPHPFVPALAKQSVRLADKCVAFAAGYQSAARPDTLCADKKTGPPK